MQAFLWLWAKRILVFGMGLGLSVLIEKQLYPFLHRHTPLWLAIFLTYLVSAYVLLPLAIRVIQVFIKPDHIPHHTMTPDGFANDPVNVGVVGTQAELEGALGAAGWVPADRRTLLSVLRMAYAIVYDQPYPTAPFSNLYLFGRKQDLGYQFGLSGNPSKRHHVRFWECRAAGSTAHEDHVRYWRRHYTPSGGRKLWLGAITTDTGIGIIRYHGQTTHTIDPDTNKARDILIQDLQRTGQVARVAQAKTREPYELKNRVLGVTMTADGSLKICELKPSKN